MVSISVLNKWVFWALHAHLWDFAYRLSLFLEGLSEHETLFSIFPVGGDKFSLKTARKIWAADCNLYHFYYHYKFSTIHDVPNSDWMPVNKLKVQWIGGHTAMPKNRPCSTFLSLKNDHIFTKIGSDDLTRSINALYVSKTLHVKWSPKARVSYNNFIDCYTKLKKQCLQLFSLLRHSPTNLKKHMEEILFLTIITSNLVFFWVLKMAGESWKFVYCPLRTKNQRMFLHQNSLDRDIMLLVHFMTFLCLLPCRMLMEKKERRSNSEGVYIIKRSSRLIHHTQREYSGAGKKLNL